VNAIDRYAARDPLGLSQMSPPSDAAVLKQHKGGTNS